MKIIYNINSCNLESTRKNAQILYIKKTFYFNLIIHFYKTLKNKFKDLISITRTKQIPLTKNKLEVGKRDSEWLATQIFNKMPRDLKNYSNLNSCEKNKIKKWICENVIYKDDIIQ